MSYTYTFIGDTLAQRAAPASLAITTIALIVATFSYSVCLTDSLSNKIIVELTLAFKAVEIYFIFDVSYTHIKEVKE